MQHDLLLGVELDVTLVRLDQQLLRLGVEGEDPLSGLVRDDDLLVALLVVERDLVARFGLHHPDRVVVGIRILHRLVLRVPQRANDVRPIRLTHLERDQDLVVYFRQPVESPPRTSGRLNDTGPVRLRHPVEPRKAHLHPSQLLRILHVRDQPDLDAEDRRRPGGGDLSRRKNLPEQVLAHRLPLLAW